MRTSALIVFDFALSKVEDAPVHVRIKIYRALSDLAPTPRERRLLISLAEDLEEIERKHRQMRLDLGDGGAS